MPEPVVAPMPLDEPMARAGATPVQPPRRRPRRGRHRRPARPRRLRPARRLRRYPGQQPAARARERPAPPRRRPRSHSTTTTAGGGQAHLARIGRRTSSSSSSSSSASTSASTSAGTTSAPPSTSTSTTTSAPPSSSSTTSSSSAPALGRPVHRGRGRVGTCVRIARCGPESLIHIACPMGLRIRFRVAARPNLLHTDLTHCPTGGRAIATALWLRHAVARSPRSAVGVLGARAAGRHRDRRRARRVPADRVRRHRLARRGRGADPLRRRSRARVRRMCSREPTTPGFGPELEAICVRKCADPPRHVARRNAGLGQPEPAGLRTLAFAPFWPADLTGVIIELTEQDAGDPAEVLRGITALRERGAAIAVDDVGSGYAGLLRVADLRPDYVKVDRRIVSGVADSAAQIAVLESLVTLSHRLGAAVIGEGVADLVRPGGARRAGRGLRAGLCDRLSCRAARAGVGRGGAGLSRGTREAFSPGRPGLGWRRRALATCTPSPPR